ncbi:hypothetical protein Mapa_009624 [Marchantia paleacea]|nr:hypothetical protein Mapa_009624 [Marchantia paleacea]
MARSRASSGLEASILKTAIIVLLGLCSLQNVDSAWLPSGPQDPSFVLYAARNGAGTPNPSQVQIFPPSGRNDPVVRVLDLALIESAYLNSREVGRLRIQTVTSFGSLYKPTAPRIQVTGVMDLNRMKNFGNGTIATQGIQTAVQVGDIGEYPVLGGTGEYRFANGYVKFTLLAPVNATGTTLLAKLEVYLCKKTSSCHD